MIYKQEEIPDRIIEAKKRLGQIKEPQLAPKIENKSHAIAEPPVQVQVEQKEETNKLTKKHWFEWDNPSTPDNVMNTRRRLGDDRYRKYNQLIEKSKQAGPSPDEPNLTDNLPLQVETSLIVNEENTNGKLVSQEIIVKEPFRIPEYNEQDVSYRLVVPNDSSIEFIHAAHRAKPVAYQLANTVNYFDTQKHQTDNYYDYDQEILNLESTNDHTNNAMLLPVVDSQFYYSQKQSDDLNVFNI